MIIIYCISVTAAINYKISSDTFVSQQPFQVVLHLNYWKRVKLCKVKKIDDLRPMNFEKLHKLDLIYWNQLYTFKFSAWVVRLAVNPWAGKLSSYFKRFKKNWKPSLQNNVWENIPLVTRQPVAINSLTNTRGSQHSSTSYLSDGVPVVPNLYGHLDPVSHSTISHSSIEYKKITAMDI